MHFETRTYALSITVKGLMDKPKRWQRIPSSPTLSINSQLFYATSFLKHVSKTASSMPNHSKMMGSKMGGLIMPCPYGQHRPRSHQAPFSNSSSSCNEIKFLPPCSCDQDAAHSMAIYTTANELMLANVPAG